MPKTLIKLARAGATLATALSLGAESVAAQAIPTPPARVTFRVGASPDLAVFGVASIAGAIPALVGTKLPYGHCAPCDSTRLWGLDRVAIGLPRAGIDRTSTLAMGATVAGAGALIALTRRGEPEWHRSALEDLAVFAEAMEIDAGLTQWAKVAFHRARPILYTSQAASSQTIDNGRSFPSGHASFSFAAAAAAASILQRRHELRSHAPEVVALFAGAAATSILRVSAHRHFPTDVAAGAVLGTALGWVIPQVHPIR
jgi:membrane-associated phospholipid phosphatase